MAQILSNPAGTHRTVTDFRTGVDNKGNDLVHTDQVVQGYIADAAVARGEALALVAPSQTAPVKVTPMTTTITGADPWRFVGVALHDAAAGEWVQVVVAGTCVIKHNSGDTPAAWNLVALPGTSTGVFAVGATDPADNGLYCGVVLGPETGTTDTCLAKIGQPLVRFEAGA